jgi:ABC-type transporter Mla maintaining outer membrane lipid asymmetry ATPase subunit MlaF
MNQTKAESRAISSQADRPHAHSANSPVVELRDVSLSFDKKQVLSDVSLVVNPQERLVIIGQSGAGKTTILRLILGILTPTQGSVFLKQLEISRLSSWELQNARTRIGMVYQDSALLSSSSVGGMQFHRITLALKPS